jgi:hypothetical protein
VIAHSSYARLEPSGWSLYLAEGQSPTRIRELPNVGAPERRRHQPGRGARRGQQVNVIFGFQVFDLTVDDMGRLPRRRHAVPDDELRQAHHADA